MVNQPPHYKIVVDGREIEVIDIMVDILQEEELRGYLKGNIIKYVLRASKKNGQEDWRKARWYLNRLIGVEDDQSNH